MKLNLAIAEVAHASEICLATEFMICLMTEN